MVRLALAVAASLGLVGVLPGSVAADVSLTQTNPVTLSCNDGHSVILGADSATLTSLAADVQSINTSGTGTSCSLATPTIDPSSETTEWTVYDYNPSNQELAPRNSPNKMPATTPDGGATWEFPFKQAIYTALFTTTDRSLTGNLTGRTLMDHISVSGDAGTFMTQHGGGDCVGNVPAAVRFYFVSPSASGSSVGSPPAGFYTKFWWSNPVHLNLIAGNQVGTITANMSDPAEWSDWNGQSGANPAVTAAFFEAIQKVQSIGLSFGGDCFFETGVTPTQPFTNEQFSSMFSEG
jgi:hypothetical protein